MYTQAQGHTTQQSHCKNNKVNVNSIKPPVESCIIERVHNL